MEQHRFKSHRHYLSEQKKLTRYKIQRGKTRCYTSEETIQAIANHFGRQARSGCCHGVRMGVEIDYCQKFFGGHWIGTEIVPEICDGKKIICADFTQVRQEWVGHFDVIYSNSFDHSRDPYKTLKWWLACLAPKGVLYVEWTEWHNSLGSKSNYADCFAAEKEEYRELMQTAGRLVAEIDVVERKFTRTLFGVQ